MPLANSVSQLATDLTAIREALTAKGAAIEQGLPLSDWPEEIASIEAGDGGGAGDWQPHDDWWDVRTMVDTGVVPWQTEPLIDTRYGFLVRDSNLTITLPNAECYLSDGAHYPAGGTHTWDRDHDMPCSDGFATRAVIVCGADRDVVVNARLGDTIWCHLGDCNATTINFGAVNVLNFIAQAMTCSRRTTADANALWANAFAGSVNFAKFDVPTGMTIFPQIGFLNTFIRDWAIPEGVVEIQNHSVSQIVTLERVTFPASLRILSGFLLHNCPRLRYVRFTHPDTHIIPENTLVGATSLVCVDVPLGWNQSLNLSASALLSISGMEDLIRNYADRSGQEPLTLALGAVNIAKLSDEIRALAAEKNILLTAAFIITRPGEMEATP